MLNKEKAHFEADIKSIVKTVRDQNPDALLILSELYNPLQLDDSIASYADMFLDGWNESVYSISKTNQPSIVLPIRKLISNDKKSYYLTKYTQMITAMQLLPIHLQSKCYPTNIKATMKQFYFYNMSFCYNDSGRGLYMESREWERIVDHLLSLVPLFIANLCFLENFLLKDICRHHIHKYYCFCMKTAH